MRGGDKNARVHAVGLRTSLVPLRSAYAPEIGDSSYFIAPLFGHYKMPADLSGTLPAGSFKCARHFVPRNVKRAIAHRRAQARDDSQRKLNKNGRKDYSAMTIGL